jgi:hypothetical protein
MAFMATGAMAMKPYFSVGGMLLFDKQDNTLSPNTEEMAIIGGVEQWYKAFSAHVRLYIYNSTPQYQYIPTRSGGWVYVQLTPTNLAGLIYDATWLDLGDTPSSVYNAIVQAIQKDKNRSGFSPDPYAYWKWRSVYMEGRYAENGSSQFINANCWGTADYLAADLQWKGYYAWQFPNGSPDAAHRFPHIYLDGPIVGSEGTNPYALDRDFINPSRSRLKADGVTTDIRPEYILNSFDLIRYGLNPSAYPSQSALIINGHDLGWLSSGHSAVYLASDVLGDSYLFEKANFGATQNAPYQIRKYGTGTYEDPSGFYNSFFKKFGNFKLNLATTYDQNWAGIRP